MSEEVAVLQPRRCASVRNVHSLLRTPQGQAGGQAMLLALWPAALQLLQDNQVEMRQTVAPVVGFLGALAARPGRPVGDTLLPGRAMRWCLALSNKQVDCTTGLILMMPLQESAQICCLNGQCLSCLVRALLDGSTWM